MATRFLIAVSMALVLGGLTTPFHALASQPEELDCTAFGSYEEANAYYIENPDADSAIDDDGDGEACEVYFGLEERAPDHRDAKDAPSTASEPAADNLDCEDFTYQEEAQAVLEADSSDPNNLDPNKDGMACALLPSNAIDTGDNAPVELAQTAEDERAQRQADREARRAARESGQDENAAADEPVEVTCADFATQADAQAAFDGDPDGLASLDGDGNGIACEELIVDGTADAAQDESREERRARRNRDAQSEATAEPTVIDEPRSAAVREDLDCIDFEFQEEAQAVFNQDPADPFNLDPNGDGFACSSLPLANPRIVQVPRTGAGSGSPLAPGILAVAALIAAGAAGTLISMSRR